MGIRSSRLNGRVSPIQLIEESAESPAVDQSPIDPPKPPTPTLSDPSPIDLPKPSTPALSEQSSIDLPKPPTPTLSNRFQIVWLDCNVNDVDHVYQNSLTRLQRLASSVHSFTDVNDCLQYLTTNTNNDRMLMIISHEFLPPIWSRVRSMPKIHSFYIISPNVENKALLDQPDRKVKGVFTKVQSIYGAVKRDNVPYLPNALGMSLIPSGRYTKKDLSHLNHLFIYWMLVKMIIRDLQFDRNTEIQAVKELATMCRAKHFANENELKIIDEFEQNYHLHSPIWWYTRDCFIAPMLNQALLTRDIEVIMRMSFFIKGLFQQMESAQFDAQKKSRLPKVVYLTQHVSHDDFQKIKNIQGNLLSFNNFFVADPKYEASLNSVRAAQRDEAGVRLLFAMKVDSKHPYSPCVSLEKISYSTEQGRFFLFSAHSVFRITEIKLLEEGIYRIDLLLTASKDEQIVSLTHLLREETRTAHNWFKLAQLMSTVKDYEHANEVYFALFDYSENDPLKMALIYNEVGLLHDEQGDYALALIYYQKAIEIRRQQLPPDHFSLSVSYNNIGEVQRQLGDYFNALDNHRKTLLIKQKILPPNDPSMATTYNNIGLANESLGEFAAALSFYQKALDIKQQTLPADHQELAITYNNIGELHRLMGNFPAALTNLEQAMRIRLKKYRPNDSSLAVPYNNLGLIHRELGNYSTALSYIQKSLEIKLETFRVNHPSLAFSYNNMGDIHQQLGEYTNALASYQKALEIQEKVFGGNHPGVATTYTHIGAAHQSMGNYSEALSFYERAVEIRLTTLPAVHPSLGTCYNNIGHVFQLMGKNSTALEYYRKTLKLQKKTLQHDHPSLATTYNNLADAQQKLGNHNKALSLYKRSLQIKQKSLPAGHPTLATSYNNFGVVYLSMKNYPAALEFFKVALEAQTKTLSPNHPNLAAGYSNMGVVLQSTKDYPNALEHFEKALEIQEKSLRVDHPDMATTHNSLATVLVNLGDLTKAMEHEQRAVEIASASLPADHPNLKIFRNHLERITYAVQSRQAQE